MPRDIRSKMSWVLVLLVLAPASVRAEEEIDPAGPGTFGQRGLLRTWAATPYAPGSLVLGSSVEFFKSSDFLLAGDDNQRLGARLTFAGVPVRGLSINAGLSLVVNSNSVHEPRDTQWVGDPFLGVRYGTMITDWMGIGAGVQAVFPTGAESFDVAFSGVSVRTVATFDFLPHPDGLVSMNVGLHLDNSAEVFDYELDAVEQFTAGANPHDQFLLSLGVGWRFGPVAPFLEVGTAQAVGAGAPGFGDNPSWLTIGLRAWPLTTRTLTLLVAVDVGLGGVDPPAGKTRTPPWNLIVGIGYDFGAESPPVEVREVVRVERVEVPVAAPAPRSAGCRITGRVVDAQTGEALGGAKVVVSGDPPGILLSDPEAGRFTTCPEDPGPLRLAVHREGYRSTTEVVLVREDQAETSVTIALHPSKGKTFGVLRGSVRALGGRAVPAVVSIPARGIKSRAKKKDGKFELKLVTGTFDVLFSLPGYVTQRQKVRLGAGDVVIMNVELYPKE